jgi:DNA mismatch repair protein MutL
MPITFELPQHGTQVNVPGIRLNPNYNPFEYEQQAKDYSYSKHPAEKNSDWQKIVSNFDNAISANFDDSESVEDSEHAFIQIKKRFIMTTVKSGIMLIDQHRAHFQILFEELQNSFELNKYVSQPLLFPQTVEFDTIQTLAFDEIIPHICKMGFEIEKQNDNIYNILAIPALLPTVSTSNFFELLIDTYQKTALDLKELLCNLVALNLATVSAIQYGKELNKEEMRHITDKLFACKSPNYTEDGKIIVQIITIDEITNRFNI